MNTLVTLNIDGKEVSVPKGTTILQAAAQVGIEIPHLCYFEGLKSTGACRMCLVEVEGAKELVISCNMRVREGMVVHTRTDEVLKARRFVLELLWSTHPGDCATCEKSGACKLQEYTYEIGIDKSRFAPLREYDASLVDRRNPLIELDHNLCILCGRCIQICEVQSNHVLEFAKRGMAMKVATAFDRPLHEAGCDFCGSCISVCPVGCLVEGRRKFRGREWEFITAETVCPYCGCGCDLLLDTIDNQVVRARNSRRYGYLCARGRFGWDYVMSPERLTQPLIRKNGELTECTWDEALGYVAERLAQIRETYGPQALGGLISPHYPNEVLYLFQKFMRAGLGTNNVDSSVRLHSLPELVGIPVPLADANGDSPFARVREADVVLLVGPDIAARYPLIEVEVKRAQARGTRVITIDPLNTRLAALSQIHLQPKAGREALVLRGLSSLLVKEGLYDETFASQRQNFEAFKTSLDSFDEEQTGVAAEKALEAAKLYGDLSQRALIVFSPEMLGLSGIQEVVNLLLLTGRVEGGALACPPASNSRGAVRMGAVAEFYPGYQPLSNLQARKEWEEAWGVSLPDQAGLSALEMLAAAGSSIRGMYLLGENVARSFPNTAEVVRALSALDLLIVQDLFLTETARLADVVLPGISFAESEGTLTGAGGETRRLRRALQPLVQPDWRTICALSSRLGFPMEYDSEDGIWKEIETLLPTSVAGGGGSFYVQKPAGMAEETDETYPFLLMVGATRLHYGDGGRTGHSQLSLVEWAEDGVRVSPEDAAALGVAAGSRVRLSSRRGSAEATVQVDPALPQGLVFMAAHAPSAHILSGSDLELTTKMPRFSLWAIAISA
jgi:formate dehydrogenase alpha subunit